MLTQPHRLQEHDVRDISWEEMTEARRLKAEVSTSAEIDTQHNKFSKYPPKVTEGLRR